MPSLPSAACMVCELVLPEHAPTCWLDRPVTAPHSIDADGFWRVNGERVYGPGPGPLRARTTWDRSCQRCHATITQPLVLFVRWESALGALFYWHGSALDAPLVAKCEACEALAAEADLAVVQQYADSRGPR